MSLDRLDHRGKLDLDPETVRKARALAEKAGRPIVDLAQQHTTVSVERATLRLAGLEGADAEGTPWVNRLADVVRADLADQGGLEHGVAMPVWDALLRGEADDLSTLAQKASAGSVRFRLPVGRDATRAVADGSDTLGCRSGGTEPRGARDGVGSRPVMSNSMKPPPRSPGAGRAGPA